MIAIVFLSLFSLLSMAGEVGAQQAKYWIDHQLDHCRVELATGRHTAMAYSPRRITYCASGDGSLEQVKEKALKYCTGNLKFNERKNMPCKIVFVDGVVTDIPAIRTELRDAKIPMSFEVFDGITDTKETKSGYLINGKFLFDRKNINRQGTYVFDRQPFTIFFDAGGKVCHGYQHSFFKGRRHLAASFEAECFGEFRFSARRVSNAGYFKDGSRYLVYFEPTFRFEKSYIRATFRKE